MKYSEADYKRLILRRTTYEWAIEETDEFGDITNIIHCDSLSEAKAFAAEHEIVLYRLTGSEDKGVTERQYAYLDASGKLPTHFNEGAKVPKRFRKP